MIINSRKILDMPMNGIATPKTQIIKPNKIFVPYYTNGIENVAWVEGLNTGAISQENVDSIYLEATYTVSNSHIAYVTNVDVDLTAIKTIYIEWENSGSDNGNNLTFFIASTNKTGNYDIYNGRLVMSRIYSKLISALDVSNLSGNFYIRFHARAAALGLTSRLKVYRVWGEG